MFARRATTGFFARLARASLASGRLLAADFNIEATETCDGGFDRACTDAFLPPATRAGEVVQHPEGVRVHHPRRWLGGHFRAPDRDPLRGFPLPARGTRARAIRGFLSFLAARTSGFLRAFSRARARSEGAGTLASSEARTPGFRGTPRTTRIWRRARSRASQKRAGARVGARGRVVSAFFVSVRATRRDVTDAPPGTARVSNERRRSAEHRKLAVDSFFLFVRAAASPRRASSSPPSRLSLTAPVPRPRACSTTVVATTRSPLLETGGTRRVRR